MARNNRGLGFEELLVQAFKTYHERGRARIEKIDPPTKVGGKRVFYLPNPWLDFGGVWTEQGGRALFLEAKHSDRPVLPIGRSPGLSASQWEAMRSWKAAGAETFVIWRHQERIRIVTPELIAAALQASGRVSIRWIDAIPCSPGHGWLRDDFLTTAGHLTTPPQCVTKGTGARSQPETRRP